MRLAWVLLLLAVALAVLIPMWSRLVDGMIFHPAPGVDLRPEQLGLVGEDVYLDTEDGVRIHAFWLPAADESTAEAGSGSAQETVITNSSFPRFIRAFLLH